MILSKQRLKYSAVWLLFCLLTASLSARVRTLVIYPPYDVSAGFQYGSLDSVEEPWSEQIRREKVYNLRLQKAGRDLPRLWPLGNVFDHINKTNADLGLTTSFQNNNDGVLVEVKLYDLDSREAVFTWHDRSDNLATSINTGTGKVRDFIVDHYRATPPVQRLWHSALVPGWGQIDNGHALWGVFLTAAHVGAISWAVYSGVQGQANVEEYESTLDTDRQRELKKENSRLSDQQNLALIILAGLYTLNLADAWFSFGDMLVSMNIKNEPYNRENTVLAAQVEKRF